MPTVTVHCFIDTLPSYPRDAVVVAIDVIRSTTTAITAVASGRRCHVVPNLDEAARLHELIDGSLLVGELGGNMPFGFDHNNSPAALADLPDPQYPAILLSSSGTRLMTVAAAQHDRVRAACLRNWRAEAGALAELAPSMVVLAGAGTRGEFREEDQLCCAWIAERLVDVGWHADPATLGLVDRWRGASVEVLEAGASAAYLRDSGQGADLAFVLSHVDDLTSTFRIDGTEVVRA